MSRCLNLGVKQIFFIRQGRPYPKCCYPVADLLPVLLLLNTLTIKDVTGVASFQSL